MSTFISLKSDSDNPIIRELHRLGYTTEELMALSKFILLLINGGTDESIHKSTDER